MFPGMECELHQKQAKKINCPTKTIGLVFHKTSTGCNLVLLDYEGQYNAVAASLNPGESSEVAMLRGLVEKLGASVSNANEMKYMVDNMYYTVNGKSIPTHIYYFMVVESKFTDPKIIKIPLNDVFKQVDEYVERKPHRDPYICARVLIALLTLFAVYI
jgi:hypothetical protein